MIKYVFGLVSSKKKIVFLSLLSLLGFVGIDIVVPFFISGYFDAIYSKAPFELVVEKAVLIVLVSVIGSLGVILLEYCSSCIASFAAYGIRKDILNSICNNSDVSVNNAELITRANEDIENIRSFLKSTLNTLAVTPVVFVVSAILLIIKKPVFFFVSLAFIIFLSAMVFAIRKGVIKNTQSQMLLTDRLNSRLNEFLKNFEIIRVFGTENREKARYSDTSQKLVKYGAKSYYYDNSVSLFFDLISGIALILIYFVMFFSKSNGDVNAFFISEMVYQLLFSFAVACIVLEGYSKAVVSYERISAMFPDRAETSGKISENGFEKTTFDLKTGCFYSITCGENASREFIGKLIADRSETSDVSVLIDGNKLTQKETVSYVSTKSFVFSDSVRNNIFMADNYENENAKKIYEMSRLTEVLQTKPQGDLTVLSDNGGELSGGQRQRLIIARGLAKKASLYILNDVFSAIDLDTAKDIIREIKKEIKDAAVVLITDRISLAGFADEIYVLGENGVESIGKHDELLQINKSYYEYYLLQKNEEGMQ